MPLVDFAETMEWIATVFEGVGVAIIALGGALALARAVVQGIEGEGYFEHAKRQFGRPLLLGLEVLVAADIIETVTVDRTLESVGELGLLVLVRTFLSFALQVELDGVLPWRRMRYEREQKRTADTAEG